MGYCSCKDNDKLGFYGVSSTANYHESVSRYGIPLADTFHCAKCREELSGDDPRTKLGTIRAKEDGRK